MYEKRGKYKMSLEHELAVMIISALDLEDISLDYDSEPEDEAIYLVEC